MNVKNDSWRSWKRKVKRKEFGSIWSMGWKGRRILIRWDWDINIFKLKKEWIKIMRKV